MNDIKPCAHCGGEMMISLHGGDFREWWQISRTPINKVMQRFCRCGILMQSETFPTDISGKEKDEYRKALIKKWNTRYEHTCIPVTEVCDDGVERAFCSYCGRLIESDFRYCTFCGGRIKDGE